jgi:hypothetical protein
MKTIGRIVHSLLCSGFLASCSVDLPRRVSAPMPDAQAQTDGPVPLEPGFVSDADTGSPHGETPMDASASRPMTSGGPPCGDEDTCSTVCEWVVTCISDVRTCARPDLAWSQHVSDVCDLACAEGGPGLARFYRNSLCTLRDCGDLAEVNLRLDAERVIMEPEVWAQHCASADLDAGPPDQGVPPPPNAPPCGEDRTCDEVCDWMQACASDERTCANPDPERTQELDYVCRQGCEQPGSASFVDLLCDQTDCADMRNIAVLDAGNGGAWSTLWQHCEEPEPPPGPPPCGEDRTCEGLCAWMQACASDERTCARPDPERTQDIDDICEQYCAAAFSRAVFTDTLCAEADCVDVRNIQILDDISDQGWSGLWQHCVENTPDSGVGSADAGAPAPDMAGAVNCNADADCPEGQMCSNGICSAIGCGRNSDCPDGLSCRNGQCVED